MTTQLKGSPRFVGPSWADRARILTSGMPWRRSSSGDVPQQDVPAQQIDVAHLTEYAHLCGFTVGTAVPATYVHVLAFPAQVSALANPHFPFPAMGLIHVANQIEQHCLLTVDDPISVTVTVGNIASHPSGQTVELVSQAYTAGELAWRGVSYYLHRGAGRDSAAPRPGFWTDTPPSGPVRWQLDSRLGPDYAKISGDSNPIHLSPLTAKMFGFPRHIAHGMWTAAKALAGVETLLPERFSYDVSFATPILLPNTVTFGSVTDEGVTTLAVTSTKPTVDDSTKPHMVGQIAPLSTQ